MRLMIVDSDVAVAAVFQQLSEEEWTPLAFFSRSLQPAKAGYSFFSRELLAVYASIRRFPSFLESRVFHILTNLNPFTFILRDNSSSNFAREIRNMTYISELYTDIHFVKGLDNNGAHALSHIGTLTFLTQKFDM